MIRIAQLQSLDFEYNEFYDSYDFKDINVKIIDNGYKLEMFFRLQDFQLYGIKDVRDLRKLIELVYGS